MSKAMAVLAGGLMIVTQAFAAETAGTADTNAVPAGTPAAPVVTGDGIDPLAVTYGNTVSIHNMKNDDRAAILFNKDNTYTYKGLRHRKQTVHEGIWLIKDGGKAVCLTPKPSKKKPILVINCVPLGPHAVNDRWELTDEGGVTYQVALMPGR
jgi:hypothetical protein